MRIFTGIPLHDATREKILRELKPFKAAGTPIRWTAEHDIHLTLKFIGEVDEALAEKAADALQRRLPAVPSFCLRLRGFGKFPAGSDLHVFWAGVEESPELLALAQSVEAALLPLGIGRDERPFLPHLTLGRSKAPRSRATGTERHDWRGMFALLEQWRDRFLAEWPVSCFRLYSSRLAPAGPEYTVLKEIPLVQP